MKQYTQKEVAKIEAVEPRSVSRWTDQELAERGWNKIGDGHGCRYYREQDGEIEEAELIGETKADLELKKLKLEIEDREQKLDRRKRLWFQVWSDKWTEAFMDSFAPLKELLAESRFEQETADKWNKTIDLCLARLLKSSDKIYQSEDISDL